MSWKGAALPSSEELKPLTDKERLLFRRFFNDPTELLATPFPAWIRNRMEIDPPTLLASQMIGFSQYQVKGDVITTSESTSSTSFGNLATTGPTLSGLPDGEYLILLSCKMVVDPGEEGRMGVSVNGAAVDTDKILTAQYGVAGFGTIDFPASTAFLQQLSNDGDNGIVAKYRVSAGTVAFSKRSVIAFKYANL